MRKTILLSTLLPGLVFLAACNGADTTTVIDDDTSSSSSLSSINAMESSSSVTESTDGSASSVDASGVRIIEMTAADWNFSPNAITSKKGEKVIVRLTGSTGIHSFGIKDLNVNVKINPGEIMDIEIPTDTVGTFEFRCMVPCGPGHKEMTGTLVVTES